MSAPSADPFVGYPYAGLADVLDDLRACAAWLTDNAAAAPNVPTITFDHGVVALCPRSYADLVETVLWLTRHDGTVDWQLCDMLVDTAKDRRHSIFDGDIGEFHVNGRGNVSIIVRQFGTQRVIVLIDWRHCG